MQRLRARQIIREFSGGLTVEKRPFSDVQFLFRQRERTVGMRGERIFPRQNDGGVRLKSAVHFRHELPHDFIARAGLREFAGQMIQRRRAFLAPTFGEFLRADAPDELAEHNRDDKIQSEQKTIFRVADDERESRRQEKKIQRQRARRAREQNRSAPQKQREQNHREQENKTRHARAGELHEQNVEQADGGQNAGGNGVLLPGKLKIYFAADKFRRNRAAFFRAHDLQINVAAVARQSAQ